MNYMRYLDNWLDQHVNENHYLFSPLHLRSIFPELSIVAFRALIQRATHATILVRICRGLYTYKNKVPRDGLTLFHIAGYLRSGEFNYISLETVLSDAGVISQIPINRITIMSSGRGSLIECEKYGSIEFVHTEKKPINLMNHLFYDKRSGLWRATVALAIKDMKQTHRNTDLIDWEAAHEFI